jgi:hypothetical protein
MIIFFCFVLKKVNTLLTTVLKLFSVIFLTVYLWHQVTCPKNGTIQDLSDALGQMTNTPGDRLTVTDVYNHR